MAHHIQILYAENDEIRLDLTLHFLEKNNFSVRTARNGDEAWKMYNELAPDILLLDIELPSKDGLEILKQIRETNRKIPVILYSDYMNHDQELKAIQLGADMCIYKNCPPQLFLAKLYNIYQRLAVEKEMKIYHISPNVKYNASSMTLYFNNKYIEIGSTEATLLHLLCVKLHETADFDFLKTGLWGKNTDNKDSALRKYITSLREILKIDPQIVIINDFGKGYRLTLREFNPNNEQN